jgi:hypothetical protein
MAKEEPRVEPSVIKLARIALRSTTTRVTEGVARPPDGWFA